jgi:hypothetical protein
MSCPKCDEHRYELSDLTSSPMTNRPMTPFDLSSLTNTTTSLTPVDGSHLVRAFTRQQVWPEKNI